jgi:hypothetical protein
MTRTLVVVVLAAAALIFTPSAWARPAAAVAPTLTAKALSKPGLRVVLSGGSKRLSRVELRLYRERQRIAGLSSPRILVASKTLRVRKLRTYHWRVARRPAGTYIVTVRFSGVLIAKRRVRVRRRPPAVSGHGKAPDGGLRPTPTPTPDPRPAQKPVPAPEPPVALPPLPSLPPASGVPMPAGDLPGWTQIFRDDFTKSIPAGQFPSAVSDRWWAYPRSYHDTTGKGIYDPSVISAHDGVLDMDIHTAGGFHLGAAPVPILPGTTRGKGQLYGRYSVRFRADAIPGYKTAWLLWPDSGKWPADGEIDFPEGDLTSTIQAFLHHQGASSDTDQERFTSGARFTGWHTATTEWQPGKVTFIFDGKVIGSSTKRVPNTPMHWVLQTETMLSGPEPSDSARGHVQIDWVSAWKYGGGGPSGPPDPQPAPIPTPTPTPVPVPPAGATQTVAAVGDTCGSCAATAALIKGWGVSALLHLGDLQYPEGTAAALANGYDKQFGPGRTGLNPITWPVFGATHDFGWAGDVVDYMNSNSAAAGQLKAGQGGYSFELGNWHVTALNYKAPAEALAFAQADAAAHPSGCQLAFWHSPYWTSDTATHKRETGMKPVVQTLYDHGYELVLNGHQHDYQRSVPLDPNVEKVLKLPSWHWTHDQGGFEGSCVRPRRTAMERAMTNTAQNVVARSRPRRQDAPLRPDRHLERGEADRRVAGHQPRRRQRHVGARGLRRDAHRGPKRVRDAAGRRRADAGRRRRPRAARGGCDRQPLGDDGRRDAAGARRRRAGHDRRELVHRLRLARASRPGLVDRRSGRARAPSAAGIASASTARAIAGRRSR